MLVAIMGAGSNGPVNPETPLIVTPGAQASIPDDRRPNTAGTINIAFRRLLKELSSFPRAIGVLTLIGICCSIGTVVEQNKVSRSFSAFQCFGCDAQLQ